MNEQEVKIRMSVWWSYEDEAWIAEAHDFGLSAFGDTPWEAMQEMCDVVELAWPDIVELAPTKQRA